MSASLPKYFAMNTTTSDVGNSSCPANSNNRNNNYSLSSSPPETILSSAHAITHVHSKADGLTSSTSASTSSASISPIYPPAMMSATPSSTDSRSFIADHNNNNNSTGSPTISPQPKKSWERQFKSYLNKQNSHNKGDHGTNNHGNGNNGFDVLLPPKLVSIKSADFTDQMRKTSHQQTSEELDHPMYSNHRQPTLPSSYSHAHSNNNPPLLAKPMSRLSVKPQIMSADKVHSTSELNASTSDTAVRGGSLFKAVFHKKKHKHSEPLKVHNKHPTLSKNRKTSSYDSLDTSQRQGLNVSQTQLRASHINANNWRTPSSGSSSLDDSVRGGYLRGRRDSSWVHQPQLLAAPIQDTSQMLSTSAGGIRTPSSKSSYRNHRNGLVHHQTPPTEIKKVFTEFHNSKAFGKDTSSPYLGDETSVHQNQIFALYNALDQNKTASSLSCSLPCSRRFDNRRQRSIDSILSGTVPLAPVCEDVAVTPLRLLLPFEGVDTWEKDRTYLVAPAILNMCPLILNLFSSGGDKSHQQCSRRPSGLSELLNAAELSSSDDDDSSLGTNDLPSPDDNSSSLFGKITLGTATVAILGTQKFTDETYGWLSGKFVLHQNYLLEYKEHDDLDSRPYGYAHLECSTVQAHEEFHDLLQLQIYGNPLKKEDRRVLLIRVGTEEERDRWVSCLKKAANLTIDDMYDCDSTLFGKGRYAVVRPARRRKTPRESPMGRPQQQNLTNQKPGSLKHSYSKSDDEFHYPSDGSLEKYDCALKIIDKQLFFDRVQQGKERIDSIVREAAVQATITSKSRSNQNLRLQGIFETAKHIVLELELLDGTDLFKHVSEKEFLDETEAAIILKDLLICLNDIQKIGIVHRDVKPANILMADRKKTGVSVKLADFGMATFVGLDELVRGRCGTPGYVAPEILVAGVNTAYGKHVDVFSAGVTLYILLCGYEPFYGENDAKLIKANKEGKVEFPDDEWSTISLEGRDLVERMMKPNPKERISASEALKHPWITRRTSASNIEHQDMNGDYFDEPHACSIS